MLHVEGEGRWRHGPVGRPPMGPSRAHFHLVGFHVSPNPFSTCLSLWSVALLLHVGLLIHVSLILVL